MDENKFKKYNSIEQVYNKIYLDKVTKKFGNEKFSVSEKVHGANCCFVCDGSSISFQKRTSVVKEGEPFYGYKDVMEKYRNAIYGVFDFMSKEYGSIETVYLFGEYFGGIYAVDGKVKADNAVQKGVYYCPQHEFYGFDIFVSCKDEKYFYIDVEHCEETYKRFGFIYAETLFKGNLDECLGYSNEFQSTIPKKFGLHDIKDNICEGIVIKPMKPLYIGDSRVIFKSKNKKFSEIKNNHRENKKIRSLQDENPILAEIVNDAERYITKNRLDNTLSKLGEIEMPKEIGKVFKLFSEDVMDEFKKINFDYSKQVEADQNTMRKKIVYKCNCFVTKNLLKY